MGGINLTATMDGLATAFDGVTNSTRAFGYPNEDAQPGDVIVGYPETIELAMTFGRGADKAVFPVWYIGGLSQDKAARDAVSAMLLGSADILDQVDGTLGGAVQYCAVRTVSFDRVLLQGSQYLSVRFDCEVVA